MKELLDHAVQHRPAPDDRCVIWREEGHRHHLEIVLLGRHDLPAIGAQLGLEPQHDRDVRTVDVAVDHAHAAAGRRQGQCQIHRHGGLAHAAFARTNRDHVLHACNRGSVQVGRHGRPHPRGHGDVDRAHAGQLHHRRAGLLLHLFFDRAGGRRQLDCQRDVSAVNRDVLDEPQRDDILVEIRILYGLEGLEYLRVFNSHESSLVLRCTITETHLCPQD